MHNFIWNHIGKGTKKASPFGKLTHEELASKSLKAISYELEDICTHCRGQFPSYVVGANLEAVPESNNIFDRHRWVPFSFHNCPVKSSDKAIRLSLRSSSVKLTKINFFNDIDDSNDMKAWWHVNFKFSKRMTFLIPTTSGYLLTFFEFWENWLKRNNALFDSRNLSQSVSTHLFDIIIIIIFLLLLLSKALFQTYWRTAIRSGWSENLLGQAVVWNTAGIGARTTVPWHGNLERCL